VRRFTQRPANRKNLAVHPIRRCFVGQVSNLRRACSPPLRHWRTLAGGRLETGRRLKTCPTRARGAWRTGTLGFQRFCGRIASGRTSTPHTPRAGAANTGAIIPIECEMN
jgi:hypothetical protein